MADSKQSGIYCCPATDFLIASFLYWNAYNPLINWKYLPWSKSPVLSQTWEAPLQHSARREKWEKVRNTSKSMENSRCGSLSLEAFPDMSKSNSTAASVSSDERTGPTHAAGGASAHRFTPAIRVNLYLKTGFQILHMMIPLRVNNS